MPLAFLILGLALAVVAIRGTYGQLGTLLANDFTGSNSFLVWFGALLAIGMIGFIPGLKKPVDMFMALIMLVLFIKNQGVFQQFASAFQNVSAATPAATMPQLSGPAPISVTNSSGGNPVSQLTSLAGSAAAVGNLFA